MPDSIQHTSSMLYAVTLHKQWLLGVLHVASLSLMMCTAHAHGRIFELCHLQHSQCRVQMALKQRRPSSLLMLGVAWHNTMLINMMLTRSTLLTPCACRSADQCVCHYLCVYVVPARISLNKPSKSGVGYC
jgi:hypothetical protein